MKAADPVEGAALQAIAASRQQKTAGACAWCFFGGNIFRL